MNLQLSNILNADVILHNQRMLNSYCRWTGEELIERKDPPKEQSEALFNAPFSVVSHGTEADPVFKYGNKKALELFEMTWEEFTKMPSRNSAEPVEQEVRAEFMAAVTKNGFVDNYEGVRISSRGKRFLMKNAIVWNVLDENGKYCGQAATFYNQEYL